MVLTIFGIGESSKVAVVIFIFHLSSLFLLAGACGFYLFQNGLSVFYENYNRPIEGSILMALFFGFSAAMLGISGFESSANYVEEQDKGIFPKTLRNMWVVVSVANPLMAFLAISIIPIPDVTENKEALLAYMGNLAAGDWMSYLISVDAALVLSGAVLTSFVGVGGLVQRMTLDRVLPQFLLKLNNKNSPYRIMIAFFLLCVSILFITQGDLAALAGVYTISFLSVMVLFGIGNILLKIRRNKLPRPETAAVLALVIAIASVIAALVGNAVLNPQYLAVFLEYLIPTLAVIGIMLYRIPILKGILYIVRYFSEGMRKVAFSTSGRLLQLISEINSQEFVFFTNEDDVSTLNKVMLYIKRNENTRKVKIVTILDNETKVPPGLQKDLEVLDRAYPEIDIEFITMKGKFGPQLIDKLSKEWNIPNNFMFIGSPGDHFPYRIEELGGVRLII